MLLSLPSEIERQIMLFWVFPSVLEELIEKYPANSKDTKYEVETTLYDYVLVFQFRAVKNGYRSITLRPETVNIKNRELDKSWNLFCD